MDRAALDFALHHAIPCGGWCPKGRLAEDGPIASRYPLQESPSSDYAERTKLNVDHSDGTLIITPGQMDSGTLLTYQYAISTGKPCIVLDVAQKNYRKVSKWLRSHKVEILNIAGPRESNAPGIYKNSCHILMAILES